MDIPRIYHVYTSNDIPCISMDIPRIYLVDIRGYIHGYTMYIHSVGYAWYIHGYIHGYTTYIPYILVRTSYTWNIHSIYQAYTENRSSRCSPPNHPYLQLISFARHLHLQPPMRDPSQTCQATPISSTAIIDQTPPSPPDSEGRA
jgi:hypothetical protein